MHGRPPRLSQRLAVWKLAIFEIGLFVWFVISYGEFLLTKLWKIIGPFLR